MNKNSNNDQLDEIEEELKEKDDKQSRTNHKVSGKSVFEIKRIIKDKSEENLKDEKRHYKK